MTPEERQQSLAAARRAVEWLRQYTSTVVWINASLKERVTSLIEGFELLDAKEQAQAEAGRESGHLGAQYGHLGGRPRKTTTKKRGKK